LHLYGFHGKILPDALNDSLNRGSANLCLGLEAGADEIERNALSRPTKVLDTSQRPIETPETAGKMFGQPVENSRIERQVSLLAAFLQKHPTTLAPWRGQADNESPGDPGRQPGWKLKLGRPFRGSEYLLLRTSQAVIAEPNESLDRPARQMLQILDDKEVGRSSRLKILLRQRCQFSSRENPHNPIRGLPGELFDEVGDQATFTDARRPVQHERIERPPDTPGGNRLGNALNRQGRRPVLRQRHPVILLWIHNPLRHHVFRLFERGPLQPHVHGVILLESAPVHKHKR
jgi:hypothetical protein